MERILELRSLVNRQLESCRSSGQLGASLEAQVQLELEAGSSADEALGWLASSSHPSVDNLADWLLVSAVEVGGEPLPSVLSEAHEDGVTVRIARAAGTKCERCWHYSSDIGTHLSHPTLCGRCVGVLERSAS